VRVVLVPPGGRIVLETPNPNSTQRPPPGPPQAVTIVQPGDIVVIGDSTTTVGPITELALRPSLALGNQIDVIVTSTPEQLTLTRTLSYLPRGLAYAFFAPFPWAAERALDLLTIPQALFWYLCLAVMPWSLWRLRHRAAALLPQLGYAGAMMVIFTLVEGNFGTLYRHRDMATPFIVMLASPGLVMLWDRLSARVTRSRA